MENCRDQGGKNNFNALKTPHAYLLKNESNNLQSTRYANHRHELHSDFSVCIFQFQSNKVGNERFLRSLVDHN